LVNVITFGLSQSDHIKLLISAIFRVATKPINLEFERKKSNREIGGKMKGKLGVVSQSVSLKRQNNSEFLSSNSWKFCSPIFILTLTASEILESFTCT